MAKQIERRDGSGFILLDDGFQHLRLQRQTDIVVIGSDRAPEEGYCLPYGDLRESYSALRYASGLVLVRENEESVKPWRLLFHKLVPNLPVFEVERRIAGLWEGDVLCDSKAMGFLGGFCGIAQPNRFAEDLARIGSGTLLKAFSDHHLYSARDVDQLLFHKEAAQARWLVTTEKDAVKVAGLFSLRSERLLTLRIRYEIPEEFWYFLEKRLANGAQGPV
jgi:tetraacyldisaccharide 4'-kinase